MFAVGHKVDVSGAGLFDHICMPRFSKLTALMIQARAANKATAEYSP